MFDKREHGESNFVLVVRITDKGRSEHFFTTDFERRDGKTMVTISHAPKIVASVKLGDRIEITEADITDWQYMRDGKYVGMTTFKARFERMPPDDGIATTQRQIGLALYQSGRYSTQFFRLVYRLWEEYKSRQQREAAFGCLTTNTVNDQLRH